MKLKFSTTLGFTCKQLKHTFCKDLIILSYRLHLRRSCPIREKQAHKLHTDTYPHMLPFTHQRLECQPALSIAALVSQAVPEVAIGITKQGR